MMFIEKVRSSKRVSASEFHVVVLLHGLRRHSIDLADESVDCGGEDGEFAARVVVVGVNELDAVSLSPVSLCFSTSETVMLRALALSYIVVRLNSFPTLLSSMTCLSLVINRRFTLVPTVLLPVNLPSMQSVSGYM